MEQRTDRILIVATILRPNGEVKTIIPAPSVGSIKRYLRFRMPQLRRAGTASKVKLAAMPSSVYQGYRKYFNV
jgi:hypothetical protein